MKAQMKFQKILSLLTLIVGALCFVYALCFFSGNLSDLMYYKSENRGRKYIPYAETADTFINNGQTFVSIMIVLGIVFICIAAFLYITSTNSRRNYYVTNYVSVGLAIGIGCIVGILMIAFISLLFSQFMVVDMSEETGIGYIYNDYKDSGAPIVGTSPVMFILGYVVALISLANGLAWIYNLVWKVKLMKGEKALLEGSPAQEVA